MKLPCAAVLVGVQTEGSDCAPQSRGSLGGCLRDRPLEV